MRHEVGATDHLSGMAREIDEERKLFRRQRNRTLTTMRAMTARVDDEIAHAELRRYSVPVTPGERAQARQKFAEIERFGEVVIGALIEPGNALLDTVQRRQHQDRHRIATRTNSATHHQSAHLRHQNVEYDRVERLRRREGEGLRSSICQLDRVRRLMQAAHHRGAELRVVFGEQQTRHGRSTNTLSVRRLTAFGE